MADCDNPNDVIYTLVSTIAAMVAALAACASAYVSYRQNRDSRKPHISIYLEQHAGAPMYFLDLVVRNDGGGVARNIKFVVDDDELELNHQMNGKTRIKDLGFVKNGISVLSQGKERSYYLLSILNRRDECAGKKVIIKIRYTDESLRKKYQDEFALDFDSLIEISVEDETSKAPKNAVAELRKISKSVAKIAQSLPKNESS